MIYVEWLYARKRLLIFTTVLVALALLVIAAGEFGTLTGNVDAAGNPRGSLGWTIGWSNEAALHMPGRIFIHTQLQRLTLPLDAFLLTASVVAYIFSIQVCTSLHRQRDSLHVAFTKPVSRTRLALEFFALDLASVAAVFAITVVCELLPIAAFGALNRLAAPSVGILIAVGGIMLLYGVMQAATSWLRGGCGGVLATLWISFFFVPALTQTPVPQINAVAGALLWLDPLRYVPNYMLAYQNPTATNHLVTYHLAPGAYDSTLFVAWAFGIVLCALAVFGWNRVEA